MFLEGSYIQKDTLVHKLNPLIKFIIFLSIVFLLFLKISFLVQFLLISFVGLIIWKSDSYENCKKYYYVYGILLLFLFGVNFVFMKNPGFWNESSMLKYKDILGIYNTAGSKSDNKLFHGWYIGGEILKSNNGELWVGDSTSCLESHLGHSGSPCSNTDHASDAWKNAWQNIDNAKNWTIFPLKGANNLKYVAFSPTWYTFSAFQVVNAFSLANKIMLIILLSSIFTATMPLSAFSYALEDLFRPLKIFDLPTKVMSLAVTISIRFVPSLIVEASRITRAQASRGIDYKNGKLRDKASALLSLFVPLFVISFIKSGELSESMTSKGYNHNHPRNVYRIYIVKYWELAILFFSLAFVTFLYFLFMNQYYFGLFSWAESLVIMAS